MVRRKKNFSEAEKFLVHFRNLSLAFCRETFPLINREQISRRGVGVWGGGFVWSSCVNNAFELENL
jgi:hypothetical protein